MESLTKKQLKLLKSVTPSVQKKFKRFEETIQTKPNINQLLKEYDIDQMDEMGKKANIYRVKLDYRFRVLIKVQNDGYSIVDLNTREKIY